MTFQLNGSEFGLKTDERVEILMKGLSTEEEAGFRKKQRENEAPYD